MYMINVGLKPFFVTPVPTPENIPKIVEIAFQTESSPPASWLYYPVAAGLLFASARILLSRTARLPFMILFGLILFLTVTSPRPYFLLILTVLGIFCISVDGIGKPRCALFVALVFALAHTAHVVWRVPHVFVPIYLSPLMLLLFGGLVALASRSTGRLATVAGASSTANLQ